MSTSRTIHKFQPGDKFHNRYTLERLIGVGGFADVWRASDDITHAVVALKIYTNLDDDGINDLSDEYSRVQSLNHTNILKANHFDRWGNLPYLVMKFCGGGSLDKHLAELSNEQILSMIVDVTSGLAYLHKNGIVHLDIKPANILIDDQNDTTTYVLSDFGISSKTKTRLSHSVQMMTNGVSMTEAYAPPEKFSAKREDRRPNPLGDIFSFGISIYEIVTGNMPFDDLSTGRQLQYENVDVDFSEIEDERIRTIVEACMQRNREDRPTAREIQKLAMRFLEPAEEPEVHPRPTDNANKTVKLKPVDGGNVPPTPPVSDSDAVVSASKPNIKMIAAIAAIVIVVAVGVFFLVSRLAGNSDKPYLAQVDTLWINDIPIEMVKIPGGSFSMGAKPGDEMADSAETPALKRVVKDFYMARTEVTQQLWETVMGDNPSTIKGAKLPVNNISAHDATKFIQRLNTKLGVNFRLPTETEWEYVAKCEVNGDGVVKDAGFEYVGTNSKPLDTGWYAENSDGTLHPVAEKKPNSFGLYDLNGNVIEWCSDTYIDYSTGNPIIDDGEQSLRGGYFTAPVEEMRSSNRGSARNDLRNPAFGLRLVY